MAAAPAVRVGTTDRLLAAASDLFARRGFHGTSIRDIAELAGANVAAGHYHYGSKEGLYLEVLRYQFARTRALLDRRGARPSRAALAAASRPALAALLETRIAATLDLLLGPPPGPHGALMQREMCDPSAALPIIVAEFIRPQLDEMEAILRRLAPRASRRTIRDTALSVFGQMLLYRFSLPVVLALLGRRSYPRGFSRRLARHIATFSLGGLARVARAPRRGRHRAA
jgi:AcrR family transcriptional regulator